MQRYSRHILLPEIGEEGQKKILNASVLVVGAGGLGCPILQYLSAAGVGRLGIVDGDTVDLSNLQRQILFNEEDLGKNKAIQASDYLSKLNSEIVLDSYPYFIDIDNALDTIEPYDIIVDGTDSFSTRYLLNDASVILKKPLVSGSLYKYEGQIAVFNRTENSPSYRCLYPEPPNPGDATACNEIGVIGVIAGIVGTMQAAEVIKIITGIGEVLDGKVLYVDLLTNTFHKMAFQLVPENKDIDELSNTEYMCANYEVDATFLTNNNNVEVVDIRELHEYSLSNKGHKNIPLSSMPDLMSLNKDNTYLFYCQSGSRSKELVKTLMQNGFDKVWSLKGGISNM